MNNFTQFRVCKKSFEKKKPMQSMCSRKCVQDNMRKWSFNSGAVANGYFKYE